MIFQTAILCLAANIFHESRGEPVLGQYAVAQVTMRRADNDPDQVCKTVYRPRQFSWTMEHKDYPWKIDRDAWDKAVRIAQVVIDGRMPIDFSHGGTHYHANYASPYWALRFTKVSIVGRHVFYKT